MKSAFLIQTNRYAPSEVVGLGTRFLIGNGHFGYRGTLDESTSVEQVGWNIAGLYDRHGSNRRETVNAYNPLFTMLKVDSVGIHPASTIPTEHVQGIDMECGTHFRESSFMIGATSVQIVSERFAVQAEKRLIVTKYGFSVSAPADLEIVTGIDADIYDVGGPHLAKPKAATHYEIAYLATRTLELGIPLVVAETTSADFPASAKPVWDLNRFVRIYRFHAEAGVNYSFVRFASVVYGGEDAATVAIDLVRSAKKQGYRSIKAENKAWWKTKWAASDVRLRGIEEAQLGLRNCIYHLISNRPRDPYRSVSARGLSGQGAGSSIYTETETFVLPFYLNTDPEAARNCVMYRVHTLPGALRKAKLDGRQGAYYAWESQETGDEMSAENNLAPSSERATHSPFMERRIDVTGVVADAALNYINRTKDLTVLSEGGLEMLIEATRFYLSCVKLDRGDGFYHVQGVFGTDDYHEGENDNAYTNRLIRHTLQGSVRAIAAMRKKDNPFVTKLFADRKYAGMVQKATRVAAKMFVPEPDERGLFSPFQGNFDHAQVAQDLDGTRGVVTPTRALRQADVVKMLAQFPDDHPDRIKKANWTHEEPHIEHGSGLSASLYALVGASIGNTEYGYSHLLKNVNYGLPGGSDADAEEAWVDAALPARSGSCYRLAVYGFAGLGHAAGKVRVDARLPKEMTGLAFKVISGPRTATVEVTKNGGTVTWNT